MRAIMCVVQALDMDLDFAEPQIQQVCFTPWVKLDGENLHKDYYFYLSISFCVGVWCNEGLGFGEG